MGVGVGARPEHGLSHHLGVGASRTRGNTIQRLKIWKIYDFIKFYNYSKIFIYHYIVSDLNESSFLIHIFSFFKYKICCFVLVVYY